MTRKRFVVKESKFVARVKSRWRAPRGMHSKVRQQHKGRPALPTPGYGRSRVDYGKGKGGLYKKVVHSKNELETLPEGHGAVLAATLGNRKRLMLLQLAAEKKVPVVNFPNVIQAIQNIETQLQARKEKRKAAAKKKSKKEEAKKAEKKSEKKAEKEKEQESVEDKLNQDRKEMEKTITKRQ
jgi:large subunit ribosomal protein L32e